MVLYLKMVHETSPSRPGRAVIAIEIKVFSYVTHNLSPMLCTRVNEILLIFTYVYALKRYAYASMRL